MHIAHTYTNFRYLWGSCGWPEVEIVAEGQSIHLLFRTASPVRVVGVYPTLCNDSQGSEGKSAPLQI